MKRMAKVAGALFLVSTCAYMIGSGILDPVLHRPDFLTHLYSDRINVVMGSLLELINAVAVMGIAMLLYPILKKHNEPFALGYFGSRIVESVLLIISTVAPLILIALSHHSISAGTAMHPYFETIGNVLLEAHSMLFQIAMIVLSLGSLLLCDVLYRSRLVPRFLSVIGFIGYAALLASSCLAIIGQDIGPVLYVPGAIFEVMFPIWIMIKGFRLHAAH
ncbi:MULTISPECIES: DUF4386 domain-containing protein [Paenibacillus]|uniref:DUF4386 domain-containing protein n=1 Tax=Paenibacillus TaxID=44249 RepID=UPI001B22AB47|nr:DUF4386 domain-containing protein [Paenibacillus lactis]MCM3496547.1 DUF4386 domain-containing protein [Paenibacillus lactis]GIO94454.1 hypothetical protein J31TS3_56810 [Paenibacillus lactis]